MPEPQPAGARSGLRAFLLYFLRLGTLGFGGPIALAGHMQQDLVEQRGWISAQEFNSALVTAWTESEIIWVFLACGLVPMVLRRPPAGPTATTLAFLPAVPVLGSASVGLLWKLLVYFAGAGQFVLGSGLAIVPFLYGGVV